MNNSGSAYTTLESLLLFQCLHAYGVGTSVFGRISDLLKKNPDITGHKYFQSGRLSPDALRNFYLERLRRELEHEQADHDGESNGDGANPRKRKKASPALPSVQESLQHQHLIPKLVNKLYASYRNEVVEQIRADEDRYEKLQREVKSIERGEWDEQLRERANGKTPTTRSPTLPRKSPHLAQKPLQPSASPQPGQNGVRAVQHGTTTPDATPQPLLEPPKAVAAQKGPSSTSPQKKNAAIDQRRTSTPQSLAPSASPQPTTAQPLAPPPPRFQQPPSSPYNGAPYPNTPFPPGQQPPPHGLPPQSGPHQNFPPAPAGPHGSPLQAQPVPPYASNNLPQYGPPPGAAQQYSPSHQGFPHQPPGPHSPGTQAQHQQRQQYPHPTQQPHPVHSSQYAQPPPQAGFMLPPFQVAPQDPTRMHPQPTASPHYAQVSTPGGSRQQPQSGRSNVQTPRPGRPVMHPLVTQARHSFSTPVNNRSPQSAMGTPLSARSLWKKSASFTGTPAASPRPIPEPIDDFEPITTPKPSPAKSRSQRKRGKGKEKEKEPDAVPNDELAAEAATPTEPQLEDSAVEPETRSGRSRRRVPPKRNRPGSLASSRAGGSVRDRSRSQSILSHTETVAADNESQAGNRIKSERGNSVDVIDEEAVDTPSQMTTRRRGAASRRKRTARDASLDEHEDQSSTPGPLRTITAPRYFARTCAPMMNDIQSHKHASTFSSAVRAKDAEGYYDIIKRPTDLKSIQKAIGIGAKQVAAAASDTPIGSPGGGGGVVELPVTSDNMPPKTIVNAAQLEKELMRMFVNAVMFNPGEDGVVEDAREMFETVQRSVSSWRNVERSSGRTEVEDTPTIEEDEVPLGKRRKV
ncbi:Bromodomain-containing protein [Paraphoma chrysanthemicola]|nr:Bromodomain-containing protein [Paraphoma chrysanthemicola]